MDKTLRPGATTQPPSALASLEELPFEIHRLILSQAPTFDALRALVRASPQLHRVYVHDRLLVLRGFIEQSFDGFLVDAHAAYLSGTNEFQLSRSDVTLWEFVDTYRNRLTTTQSDLAAQLPLEHLIQLVRFHRSVIEPLAERYTTWALAALSSSPHMCKYPLSGTERQRLLRALYRIEVFCNLCGFKGEGRSAAVYIRSHVDRLRVLSLFPAWQIEEILCIHEFAKDTYGGVFDRVAWDLDELRNPRYRHLNMTSINEDLLLFSLPEYCINQRSLDSLLRQGLTLLSTLLRITDHEELVDLVRQSILGAQRERRYYAWLDDAVQELPQITRREEWYLEEDAAQDRRVKTPFVTDALGLPPLAWVTFWRGEASNLFGFYVPGTFRRWGYVMWDAPRLRASGAMKYIDMELESRLAYFGDPREPDYLTEDSEA